MFRFSSFAFRSIGLCALFFFLVTSIVDAAVRVDLKQPGVSAEVEGAASENSTSLTGRILADYRSETEGFLALEDLMGEIHLLKPDEILAVTDDETPYQPAKRLEMQKALQRQFGKSFKASMTEHFVFVYNTSEGYMIWCGKLFESLYTAFEKYQSRKGFDLKHPKLPMPVILLSNKTEFEAFVQKDAVGTSKDIIAYYHRFKNHIVLYDLSGFESYIPQKKKRSPTYKNIEQILARPQAAFNVATIVHEATHQISFNRGLLLRSGPFPLWCTEGISMFFESPDPNSNRGWSHQGQAKPNPYRLALLRKILPRSGPDLLRGVIAEEKYFDNALSSYAVSWALYYYLNERAPKKLLAYIELVNKKIPFTVYPPNERLEDFEKCFGNDWEKLYRNFNRFFQNLR